MQQMMPSETLIGEPVAVVREKSDEDLKKAWQEIMEKECHQSYGMLRKKLL